jgi:hypothetical protein
VRTDSEKSPMKKFVSPLGWYHTRMPWRPAARECQWTGLRLSCDADLAFAFVAAMPAALALDILVGSDAKLEALPNRCLVRYVTTKLIH